jgi:hypothetical protein
MFKPVAKIANILIEIIVLERTLFWDATQCPGDDY